MCSCGIIIHSSTILKGCLVENKPLLIPNFTTEKKNHHLIGPICAPAEILKSDWSILPCRTIPHRAVAPPPSNIIWLVQYVRLLKYSNLIGRYFRTVPHRAVAHAHNNPVTSSPLTSIPQPCDCISPWTHHPLHPVTSSLLPTYRSVSRRDNSRELWGCVNCTF